MDAKADLAFTVALEVLRLRDRRHLRCVGQKPVAEITDAEINESLERMAKQNVSYDSKDGAATAGDRVVVDFVGRIGGEEFQGGTAQDIKVDLGSNSFIPGFEDQLVGLKAGDTKLVTVTFPANYTAAHLAGKDAAFDVTVEVQAPGERRSTTSSQRASAWRASTS